MADTREIGKPVDHSMLVTRSGLPGEPRGATVPLLDVSLDRV